MADLRVELAIKEDLCYSDSNYRDIPLELEALKQAIIETDSDALSLDPIDLEEYLLNKIPFEISKTQQGSDILSLNLKFSQNNNNNQPEESMDLNL